MDPDCDFNSFITPPTPDELITGYAAFNPHATFILNDHHYEATNKEWQKWTSAMPTPAHWYSQKTLRDLIAGNLSIERNNGHQKTVREFVSEFRGLSSTAKQKKVAGDYAREKLCDFEQDGDIDLDRLTGLLDAICCGGWVCGKQRQG